MLIIEMTQNNESRTINNAAVEEQLNELEQQNNAAQSKKKQGSTNEMQTMATEEGLTQ